MTKKKNSRQKHQKDASIDDTSEEELKEVKNQGKVCPHVSKGINFSRIKKNLKSTESLITCNGCTIVDTEIGEFPEVWLCLQCGYRGCGRMSENKHGLQHFKTLHSDCHSLVLSPSSEVVWCYNCDDEINIQTSRNLKQCVQFILKLHTDSTSRMSNSSSKIDSKKTEDLSVAQQSIQEASKEEINADNSQEALKLDGVKKDINNKRDITIKKIPVKGLRNLGNTCFFNAVMQNLSQTHLFYHELEASCNPSNLWEVPQMVVTGNAIIEDVNAGNMKLLLPPQYSLGKSMLSFFQQMNTPSSSKTDVINPSSLFSEMSVKFPQLRHFHQQDSHELLRQLLEGVRQEEIKRQKKAILKHFGLEAANPDKVDEDTKKLIKAYGSYASHTIVEKVFGGMLISMVFCEECKISSQVFEPFMDLSLPLFEEKPMRNRKSDVEIEEQSEEFVIRKSKDEHSKPSKYQERKMKQLAKKEKKKAKNARNHKGLQVIENGSLSQVNEAKEEEHYPDKKPEEEQDEDENVNTEQGSEKNEQDNEMNLMGEENCVEDKLTSIVNDNNKAVHEMLNGKCEDVDGEFLSEEKAVRQKLLEMSNVTTGNCNDHLKSGKGISEINEMKISHATNDMKNENVTCLAEEFNDSLHFCTDEDSLSLDKRMQQLSMEVKDVRIRRDSDRQENFLNSDDSQNENSSLSKSSDESGSQNINCASHSSLIDDANSGCNINCSSALSEKQMKEWIQKSLTTLKPRPHVSPLECSINSCLSHFTKPELLTGSNKFRCENCTTLTCKKTGNKKDVVYTNATKQLLIFSPPAILTLHLKRFTQMGMGLRKVNSFVEFPIVLDLAPFCCLTCQILPHMSFVKDEVLYSLYGVVEHSGRLTSGHYTAYVKVCRRALIQSFMIHLPLPQDLEQLIHKFSRLNLSSSDKSKTSDVTEDYRWYYVSDSHVKEVTETQVLRCQAYLLFYERIK